MTPKEVANGYFGQGRVMQLATLHGDQPRASSVFYVTSDDMQNVYWLSEPARRHSLDIQQNRLVGGAVVIKEDLPVVGLQFEGEAGEVDDRDEQRNVIERYSEKYGNSVDELYDRIVAGTNKHHLYKVVIKRLELFDDVHFPQQSPVAITL